MKLKSLLKEIILYEISIDQIKSQFVDTGKLKPEDFDSIIDASGGNSAYATWLTARVVGSKRQSPMIKSEDIYKYKNYLATFKSRRREFPFKDINQIKSPQDLSKFISTAVELRNQEEEDPSKAKGISKEEKYAKLKIGEVAGFTVYKIPKGATQLKQVSCDLGSGTEWCTAHSDADYFEEYIQKGPLYIFDNGKGEKYQFHYEANQFMDRYDNPVIEDEDEYNNGYEEEDDDGGINPLIMQFLQYLEDIEERRIPLKLKLLNPDQFKLTPDDLNVEDLDLEQISDISLPEGLNVKNLTLKFATNITLPEDLNVENLNLTGAKNVSFPNSLSVKRDLNLGILKNSTLPNNLSVGRDLYMEATTKVILPNNINVGRDFNLDHTSLDNLSFDSINIGRDFYLRYGRRRTNSLPYNLNVGGDLYINVTSLAEKSQDEIRKMAPGVKGKISKN